MGKLRPGYLTDNGFAPCDVFIETGTQSGLRTARVAHLFKEVHTIEIDPYLHGDATLRLESYRHVRCHHGDSAKVLPNIIDPRRQTLFWLDAHCNPGDKKSERLQCPLMGELAAILSTGWAAPLTILIDDALRFQTWTWRERPELVAGLDRDQWPHERDIRAIVESHRRTMRQDGNVFVVE